MTSFEYSNTTNAIAVLLVTPSQLLYLDILLKW